MKGIVRKGRTKMKGRKSEGNRRFKTTQMVRGEIKRIKKAWFRLKGEAVRDKGDDEKGKGIT